VRLRIRTPGASPDSLKTVLQAYIDAFAAHVAKHHG